MQLKKELNTSYCEFGYEYIEDYVEKHVIPDSWNKIQLYIITETLVNFIDNYTEKFMKKGFPGDPVWVFERMIAINQRIQQYGDRGEDTELQELKKPLDEFRKLMRDPRQHILTTDVADLINRPIQFIKHWFEKLSLLRHGDCFDATHIQQAHIIVNDLLTTAIYSIKKTDAYRQAAADGKLYYDLTAHLTTENLISKQEIKVKRLSPDSSSTDTGFGYYQSTSFFYTLPNSSLASSNSTSASSDIASSR